MTTLGSWQDALMRLHVSGWDTDDIDAACEALMEACEEKPGVELHDLVWEDVDDLLEVDVAPVDAPAILILARVRTSQNAQSEALREALYDLDAFAYAYAGDD